MTTAKSRKRIWAATAGDDPVRPARRKPATQAAPETGGDADTQIDWMRDRQSDRDPGVESSRLAEPNIDLQRPPESRAP